AEVLDEGEEGEGVLGVDGRAAERGIREGAMGRPVLTGASGGVGARAWRSATGDQCLASVRQSALRATRASVPRGSRGEREGPGAEGPERRGGSGARGDGAGCERALDSGGVSMLIAEV